MSKCPISGEHSKSVRPVEPNGIACVLPSDEMGDISLVFDTVGTQTVLSPRCVGVYDQMNLFSVKGAVR